MTNNSNSFLDLKIIWKDDDMFELEVKSSNGRYSGITSVYKTSETLTQFANSLKGYPKNNEVLFYEVGQRDNYAYFSMKFYCLDVAGHIGVHINLEENVSTDYRPEEKDKITLEMNVEPASIDRFQKDLLALSVNATGQAIVFGHN